MQFDLSKPQKLLQESARTLFERECSLERVRELMETPDAFDTGLWEQFVDQGWTGLVFPESVDGLDGRPEASNLVGIFAALTGGSKASVLAEYGGQGFGAFKPALAEVAVEYLAPISDEYRRLIAEQAEIDRILQKGADRAREVAEPVIAEAKAAIGFWG